MREMNLIFKKIIEYFAFTYFNWLVVVPSLIPFMLWWVGVSMEQLYTWIIMSVFTSMYIGWVTVKADSIFAPWFYRKMRMNRKTREQMIVERLEKRIEIHRQTKKDLEEAEKNYLDIKLSNKADMFKACQSDMLNELEGIRGNNEKFIKGKK